jgi:hypothetical protein
MAKSRSDPDSQHFYLVYPYITREVVVYMERPIEPNKGTSVTDMAGSLNVFLEGSGVLNR